MHTLKFSKQAQRDSLLLKQAGLKFKVQKILNEIILNPSFPPAKKLSGNLDGLYSRRINLKHRVVYEVIKEAKMVKILRMWSHYE